jgi:hypothetical protein
MAKWKDCWLLQVWRYLLHITYKSSLLICPCAQMTSKLSRLKWQQFSLFQFLWLRNLYEV